MLIRDLLSKRREFIIELLSHETGDVTKATRLADMIIAVDPASQLLHIFNGYTKEFYEAAEMMLSAKAYKKQHGENPTYIAMKNAGWMALESAFRTMNTQKLTIRSGKIISADPENPDPQRTH